MSKPFEARVRIIGTCVYGNVMFSIEDRKFLTSNVPADKVDFSKSSIYLTGKLFDNEHIMAETFESWNDQVLHL
ncbi:hypothetical protein Riggi_59 [Bacillus phage Riggi]|uniref:Uncharacterized protein n=1 Tax=Bacillus phage Riggi TaxID=2884426 RepID=U5PWT1_9CAUD|nr:hypothetical protein Riggi_59 [Bacillus phage Riggi]AGY48221.1 hypothetical protein Riggi_59 [Bacillus phage Riggi]